MPYSTPWIHYIMPNGPDLGKGYMACYIVPVETKPGKIQFIRLGTPHQLPTLRLQSPDYYAWGADLVISSRSLADEHPA